MPKRGFQDEAMPKMGLVKNYLRFRHEATFGLVATANLGASIHYLPLMNTKDRYVAVPANEEVLIWDLKTKQVFGRLGTGFDNISEVTVMDCSCNGLIAVGHANGMVRVFQYETGELRNTFTGHRTSISALKFDRDGSRLASGGKDCNIVIWDIIGERGLYSLKGHKNMISELQFLYNEEYQRDLIVSGSTDAVSTIKFWDLQTQHCFLTLSGQSEGVWSFVITKDSTRLISGSAGPELRVYSIKFVPVDVDEYGLQVEHMGNILRNTNALSGRVQKLTMDPEKKLIFCHSDKYIELYALRTKEEALSYAKKQAKKQARKLKRKRESLLEDGSVLEEIDEPKQTISSLDELSPHQSVECEINSKLGSHKLNEKVKALCVQKTSAKAGVDMYKLTVISSNNIVAYILQPEVTEGKPELKEIQSLGSLSHRTDVRAIAISPDDSLIMSASGESVKVWRSETRSCIATIRSGYATCCAFATAQHISGNYDSRFVLVGTKDGCLQVFDLSTAKLVETYQVCEEQKPVTSICTIPDQTGLVCGLENGNAKFYHYAWLTKKPEEEGNEIADGEPDSDSEGGNDIVLGLEEAQTLPFKEGITNIKVSANNKLVAVALLDSTVRVHFLDSFKYFLTMYGHKFPVTTMDISDDSTMLVTGSADKNMKIWGLDFGDCHKSIFAHEEAITCVKFVPKTHHVFTCGRDKVIKLWDCDKFIKIQTIKCHLSEIWSLDVSSRGKFLVSSSHDKSMRIIRKTDEIIVPADEEETERELEDERNVYEKQENIIIGEANQETGFAAKMTIQTIKTTDGLIEAIDVFGNEQQNEASYQAECEAAERSGKQKPAEPEHDPLLMTAQTTDYNRYMLEMIRRIPSSDLEQVLLTLPFDYVRKLLIILVLLLKKRWDVELLVRCSTFLLRVNFGQIASCSALVPVITELKTIIMETSNQLRDCAGKNLYALEHLSLNRKYILTKV